MKLETANNFVASGGVRKSGKFTIEQNSQAFKILSDGLYTDKIKAIIRELSCNARDSHIDAGHNEPILIHLPNAIEPWFAVQDFGLGMSTDDVMNLYTTYFHSTKSNSNDVTGCLGLGSKSPFSYTDQFTVTSCFNGIKCLYSAFIGEDGSPQIALMNESKTDDRNGIEVKISVEQKDFYRFNQTTSNTLIYFNPLPKVIGVPDFEFSPPEYIISGTNWAIRNAVGRGVRAIQGSVAYPVSFDGIDDDTLDGMADMPIDIMFDIGDLMVTASRETLSYGENEPTIDSIKKACHIVLAELNTEIQKEFDTCKTLWEATQKMNKFYTDNSYFISSLVRKDKIDIKFNGESIGTNKNITVTSDDLSSDDSVVMLSVKKFKMNHRSRVSSVKMEEVYSYGGNWELYPSQTVEVFENDLGRGARARISNYINSPDNNTTNVYMIACDDKKLMDKFIKLAGDPQVKKISDLPKPIRAKTEQTAATTIYEYYPAVYGDGKWLNAERDFKDGGFYVKLVRTKPIMGETKMEDRMSSILELAKCLNIVDKNTTVYGIPARFIKTAEKDPNWIDFWEYVKKAILDKVDDNDALNSFIALSNNSIELDNLPRMLNRMSADDVSTKRLIDGIDDKKSSVIEFLNQYNLIVGGDNSEFRDIFNLIKKVNMDIVPKTTYDLSGEWLTISKKYPMLTLLTDSYVYNNTKSISCIVDYINLIDQTS